MEIGSEVSLGVSLDALLGETVTIRTELLQVMRMMRINGVRQGEQEVLNLLGNIEQEIKGMHTSIARIKGINEGKQ